jgi:3-isopropylmalate/(R)-2-methylmalate dehydratase small subunit
MKDFSGRVLFLDRSDINTDEIIPAKYLTEISRKGLKSHLLEDLEIEEFMAERDIEGKNVIIARKNFGCGSSREHAPWALEANGINLVVAESFARIFRQNMFNCGMMAVELPLESIERIFSIFAGKNTSIVTLIQENKFLFQAEDVTEEVFFSVSDFDMALVEAGGWLEYADSRY